METKEEYLKRMADKMKNFDATKRENILQSLAHDYDKREQEKTREQERIEAIKAQMIPKEKLIDGGLYTGPEDLARGMWFGVWDVKKQMFQCMRYKFGWQQFELPYFGDVTEREAGLAPMRKVEKE